MVRADDVASAVSARKPVPYSRLAAESISTESRSPPMASQSTESSLKKKAARKKPVITGIWPCKINGCNKQFAREADLKRHQRTTKLHSMPSFSCPQCDANFTRTDALRRHQKSRHDGVIIEPIEREKDDDDRSHSGTPSSKGKEKASALPVPMHQGAPTQLGPSSYYRSHTVTITPYIPPGPPQPPAPVPSTNPPASWPSIPPSWQNGTLPPNMGPMSYIGVYYHPSPHYRPHTNDYHTGHSPPPTSQPYLPRLHPTDGDAPTSESTSSNSTSQPPVSSAPILQNNNSNIDPALDADTALTEADVAAAVQAVLLQAESEEAAKQERERRRRQELDRADTVKNTLSDTMDAAPGIESQTMRIEDGLDGMHGYSTSSLRRPEPMEHILTEDGEPMLNPAELLTQESLASPPPS